MMTTPTNTDRAEWAIIGLQAFRDRVVHGPGDRDLTERETFEEALGDLLGNLMHYANRQGWFDEETIPEMFERLLERGRFYFEDEVREERQDALLEQFPPAPEGKRWGHPADGRHPADELDDFRCGHWVLVDEEDSDA